MSLDVAAKEPQKHRQQAEVEAGLIWPWGMKQRVTYGQLLATGSRPSCLSSKMGKAHYNGDYKPIARFHR